MIHVLSNLTSDYDLQVALLERRIGDVEQPLTVTEIRPELSLHLERINKLNKDNGENSGEMAFMAVNLKANVEIAERLDTSRSNVKIEEIKMAVLTVAIQLEEFFVIIPASRDMSRKTVSNSRKGTHD
jgi:hypothetical protein